MPDSGVCTVATTDLHPAGEKVCGNVWHVRVVQHYVSLGVMMERTAGPYGMHRLTWKTSYQKLYPSLYIVMFI
jgi:hypothetical protein